MSYVPERVLYALTASGAEGGLTKPIATSSACASSLRGTRAWVKGGVKLGRVKVRRWGYFWGGFVWE